MAKKLLVKPKSIFFVCIDSDKDVIGNAFINDFDCVYFGRCEECFSLFEHISVFPDLLFLDPSADESKSFDLVRFLSVLGIPVVILAVEGSDIERRFSMVGGVSILNKPVSEEILYSKLDSILQKSFIQNNLIERVSLSAQQADNRYFDKSADDVFLQALTSLSATLDAKDSYTQGHSLRVSLYSCVLAKKYGLSDKDISVIHYCSLVHDIGKVGVPDTVLRKSGKLSREERALVNRHTVIGHAILHCLTMMPELAQTARSHHERWDGTGYPDKLKGNDIPFISRIVTIADSFDAMTSNRSYRPSMSFEKASAEILRCSGTEFDPELANLAASLVNEYVEKGTIPSLFD